MKKTSKIKGKFSRRLPNHVGIPCENQSSEKLRKEHDHWKRAIKNRNCREFSDLLYWQKASTCSYL